MTLSISEENRLMAEALQALMNELYKLDLSVVKGATSLNSPAQAANKILLTRKRRIEESRHDKRIHRG